MARLRFETDLGSSLKASQDLANSYDKVGDKLGEAAGEAKKLEMAAKRIVDSNLSPQERYNQKIETMAKAVRAGKLSMEEAERTAARLRQRLDEAGKSSMAVFGANALSAVKSYLTGMVGIGSAIALFRSEMEAIRAESERIAQTQLGAAESRDVLKRNIFGLPAAEREGVLSRATAMAAQTRLPQGVIDQALAATISARGGRVREAEQFLGFAARFTRDPTQLGEFAGSLGDIANALGTNDPQQALGFMGLASQQARPTDLRQIARNLPKITQAVRGAGGDPRVGAALFSAITVGAADPQGEMSRTAGIQLTGRIREFFKGDTRGFDSQIGSLLSDPEQARKFLDKFKFEAGAQPAIEALFLDPQSAARRSYESTFTAIGGPEAQRREGGRGVDFLAGGKFAQTRLVEQTIASAEEQFALTQNAELTSESRDRVTRRLARLGDMSWTTAKIRTRGRTGPTMSPGEAVSELETALDAAETHFSTGWQSQNQELIENTRAMVNELRRIHDAQQPVRAPAPHGRAEN